MAVSTGVVGKGRVLVAKYHRGMSRYVKPVGRDAKNAKHTDSGSVSETASPHSADRALEVSSLSSYSHVSGTNPRTTLPRDVFVAGAYQSGTRIGDRATIVVLSQRLYKTTKCI